MMSLINTIGEDRRTFTKRDPVRLSDGIQHLTNHRSKDPSTALADRVAQPLLSCFEKKRSENEATISPAATTHTITDTEGKATP